MNIFRTLKSLVDDRNVYLVGLVDVWALKFGVVGEEHPKFKVAYDKSSELYGAFLVSKVKAVRECVILMLEKCILKFILKPWFQSLKELIVLDCCGI